MPAPRIRYSQHLVVRLKLRGISRTLPRTVFSRASRRFTDGMTGFSVAVHAMRFQGKRREMCLVYCKDRDEILFITIHPLKTRQVNNRLQSGRWRIIKNGE